MMKSIGHEKGFRCRKCHLSATSQQAEFSYIPRPLSEGFYEVPVSAQRHLSKPLKRYKKTTGHAKKLPKSL
jgi:tRNA(Ile2)-agmatinylcytidine synthase